MYSTYLHRLIGRKAVLWRPWSATPSCTGYQGIPHPFWPYIIIYTRKICAMLDSPPCPLDMHMCTLVPSWHAHVGYGIASPPYMVNDDRLDRYINLSECQDSVRNSMQRSQVKHRQKNTSCVIQCSHSASRQQLRDGWFSQMWMAAFTSSS